MHHEKAEGRISLHSSAPTIASFDHAFLSPYKMNNQSQPWSVSGAIYDAQGKIVEHSVRSGGHHGDHFVSVNPDRIAVEEFHEAPVVTGRSIYLGNLMAQYGHFVTETLSTFWPLVDSEPYDHYVFHPFIFGSSIPHFAPFFFDAFGMQLENVLILDSHARFECIDVPERLITLNHCANNGMQDVYSRIRSSALRHSPNQVSKKIYLSRYFNSVKKSTRSIVNEPLLERFFQHLGFNIVYPEQLDVSSQIALYSRTEVIAGISGSSLHNCVFMRPGGHIIEIGDARSQDAIHPMQSICNRLGQVTETYLPFKGTRLFWSSNISVVKMRFVQATLAAHFLFVDEELPSRSYPHVKDWVRCAILLGLGCAREAKWLISRFFRKTGLKI